MVLLPGPKDITFLKGVNEETHRLFFPEIKYYPRMIDDEETDLLYGESKDAVFDVRPVELPAFVDYNVERSRLLTLFGKDEERDLIIWCSTEVMTGEDVIIKSGDVFIVDDKEFEVMDESLESHIMNENLYLERGYSTKMRRGSSIVDDRVDPYVNKPDDQEGELGEEPMRYDPLYPEN